MKQFLSLLVIAVLVSGTTFPFTTLAKGTTPGGQIIPQGDFFNNNPLDLPTLQVINVTANPGSTFWQNSVNAAPGDVIAMRISYHNTSLASTINTRLKMVPFNSPVILPATTVMFNGGVSSDNSTFDSGIASVKLTNYKKMTFVPGSARWYPDLPLSGGFSYTILTSTQEATIFSQTGFNTGTILPDSACPPFNHFCHQGALVMHFVVAQ